jgi:hypothetical protein
MCIIYIKPIILWDIFIIAQFLDWYDNLGIKTLEEL